MANLGAIAVCRQQGRLTWSRFTIAPSQIGLIIGQYAAHGGYIYVG